MAKEKSNSGSEQLAASKGSHSERAYFQESIRTLAMLISPAGTSTRGAYDPQEFMKNINLFLRDFARTIPCELGSIYMVNLVNKGLKGIATFGYQKEISDITYSLGEQHLEGSDLEKQGITAFVATTGKPEWFDQKRNPQSHMAHAGKIDSRQWIDGRQFKNCGILPLSIGNETIGVIKLENIGSKGPSHVITKDKKELIEQIVPLISLAIDRYRRGTAPQDVFFRVTAKNKLAFESIELGHVLIEHVLTSICKSDYEYYAHNKSREKLKERLPLVLGHETVGMVRESGYNQKYYSRKEGEPIHVGDRVVVIPQIPCKKCSTCEASDGTVDSYGENYCENVKHMASNSDGSLQTHYRYWPQLLIKIPQDLSNRMAVLTEPISQLVQVWRELGFAQDRSGFDLSIPNKKLGSELNEIQLANAFNIPVQKFNDYFQVFATSSQTPRAVLRLPWSNVQNDQIMKMPFSHYALMRRGLFLTALRKGTLSIMKKTPKILVLGTGPLAYIAIVLLRIAYNVPREQVYVYGRRDESVNRFRHLAKGINLSKPEVDGRYLGYEMLDDIPEIELRQRAISEYLQGEEIKFDIILDCVGGAATENLINFALDNIAHQGIIALFGLSDQPITVDFAKVLRNEVTFKGFFRACRGSYEEALQYLQGEEFGKQIEKLLHEKTIVVSNECKLKEAFDMSASKEFWGKILVQLSREEIN